MFVTPTDLNGKRVLIVEDEPLIALLVEHFLMDFGCIVVRTCGTLEAALDAVKTDIFDIATLDVNLNGIKVYPVAEALTQRHIPFLLVSGYGDQAVPPGHKGEWMVCTKPFRADDLAAMVSMVLTQAHRAELEACSGRADAAHGRPISREAPHCAQWVSMDVPLSE